GTSGYYEVLRETATPFPRLESGPVGARSADTLKHCRHRRFRKGRATQIPALAGQGRAGQPGPKEHSGSARWSSERSGTPSDSLPPLVSRLDPLLKLRQVFRIAIARPLQFVCARESYPLTPDGFNRRYPSLRLTDPIIEELTKCLYAR